MKISLLLIGLSIGLIVFPCQTAFGELQTTGTFYGQNPPNWKDWGRPPNRVSGGSRGTLSEQSMVALVPGSPLSDSTPSLSYPARTVSESLTVWIYVPQAYQSAHSAELVLLDKTGGTLLWRYQMEPFQTNQDHATIIHFPIDYPLEQGQDYRWQFIVTVDPDNNTENLMVEGLIEAVTPTMEIARQLENAQSQPTQIDEVYTQHGIWHSALTLSGKSLLQDPNNEDIQATWSNLLSSVGLEEFAAVPIVDCCNPSAQAL